ncbi:hypothetical protein [Jiangella gansuensis]|uniref:hypothetical protein n=1 Tax=Jiangella gansuensis TaxID=281473 RepID=UPI00047DD291|nr:hypothetical protein [Jiangella gansuensis]
MNAVITEGRPAGPAGADVGTSMVPGVDTSTLTAELRERSATVIGAELRRLAGRAQGLSERDLEVVEAALAELTERLILAPLRALPGRADQVRQLFGLEAGS